MGDEAANGELELSYGKRPSGMRIGTCEGCGARLMYVRHARTGKPAPIEVQPSEDGNVLVTGSTYEIVPAEERDKVKLRGFILRKNHFATCEHAATYAKPRAPKRPETISNVIRGPWETLTN